MEQTHNKTQKYHAKYKLDTAITIMLIFVGASIVNVVIGMMLFPILTHICANALLLGVAKIGYIGIITLVCGIFLEAYNLYEHHKKHVAAIVVLTIIIASIVTFLLHYIAEIYTCTL